MRSITARLVASVLVMVTITVAVVTTVVAVRGSHLGRTQAAAYAQAMSLRYASDVDQELNSAYAVAQTTAQTMRSLQANGADRSQLSQVVRDIVQAHPNYLGLGTAWEPDVFDGRDARFVNQETYGPTGRMLAYWYRSEGTTKPLVLEDVTKGDYYLVPQRTRQPVVMDPYTYPVDGVQTLMTTIAVPILNDSTFLGVVTLDLPIGSLSREVSALKPYGNGYASLITASGVVGAHPDTKLVGSVLTGAGKKLAKEVSRTGKASSGFATDSYGGYEAVEAAAPVFIAGVTTWSLLVVAPLKTVLAEAAATRDQTILLGFMALVAAGVSTWLIARRLTRPIIALRDRMAEIADGDGDLRLRVDENRRDELGSLGAAFNRFASRVADTVRRISEQADSLASTSSQLAEGSSRIGIAVDAAAVQADEVANSAKHVSGRISSVAAATEEMGASISSIAQSTTEAAHVAATAVEASQRTTNVISALADSSAEINAVVNTIAAIAAQTNLLALNATIEAARAGDAGRSFAVVASEVKDLATETAQATEDIDRRIATIQQDVAGAAAALAEIGGIIERIDGLQTIIASAVEEQDATTREMTQCISDAAGGAERIAQSIDQVAGTVQQTSSGTDAARQSATEMAQMAHELRQLVGRFTV